MFSGGWHLLVAGGGVGHHLASFSGLLLAGCCGLLGPAIFAGWQRRGWRCLPLR